MRYFVAYFCRERCWINEHVPYTEELNAAHQEMNKLVRDYPLYHFQVVEADTDLATLPKPPHWKKDGTDR